MFLTWDEAEILYMSTTCYMAYLQRRAKEVEAVIETPEGTEIYVADAISASFVDVKNLRQRLVNEIGGFEEVTIEHFQMEDK